MVLCILFVYRDVGKCEFIGFDDDLYVSENVYVQQGLTLSGVKWAFTAQHASTWQPLVWLSYMAESQMLHHDLRPALFHWTNLLLHIANSILLFLLLSKATSCFWESFFVASLFALHPLHVESVVWVAERKDVLSTFFWMLTLWFYTKYTRRPGVVVYALFVVALAMGLMAKPMLVTIPFVMILMDYWPLRRMQKGIGFIVTEKIPLLLPVLASCVITFMVQKKGGSLVSFDQVPFIVRLADAPVFYVNYIVKMFRPWPLAVLYPHPGMYPLWRIAGSVALLCFVSIVVLQRRRKEPYLLTGWLWYLGTMVPVIGLIQIGLHGMADRFAYIPLVGLYIMIAWPVGNIVRQRNVSPKYVIVAVIMVLSALAAITHVQVRYWKDNITLFSHAVNVTKNNWAMHNCLGAAMERAGDMDAALGEFAIAAQINPTRPRIFYNMGCVLQRTGKVDASVVAYQKALDIDDKYLKARFNSGCALEQLGRYAEAIAQYEEVLKLDAGHIMAYNNLGNVCSKQGLLEDAAKHYESALLIDPGYVNARYNLGVVLFRMQRLGEAVEQFKEVVRRQPGHASALENIGIILQRMKKTND